MQTPSCESHPECRQAIRWDGSRRLSATASAPCLLRCNSDVCCYLTYFRVGCQITISSLFLSFPLLPDSSHRRSGHVIPSETQSRDPDFGAARSAANSLGADRQLNNLEFTCGCAGRILQLGLDAVLQRLTCSFSGVQFGPSTHCVHLICFSIRATGQVLFLELGRKKCAIDLCTTTRHSIPHPSVHRANRDWACTAQDHRKKTSSQGKRNHLG